MATVMEAPLTAPSLGSLQKPLDPVSSESFRRPGSLVHDALASLAEKPSFGFNICRKQGHDSIRHARAHDHHRARALARRGAFFSRLR